MIRLFVLIGIVGGLIITYLATFAVGPVTQLPPPVSLLEKYQAAGVVPGANEVVENEEIEHDIFEVPPEDKRQLEMIMSSGGMNMGGGGAMDMSGDGTMNKSEGDQPMNMTDGDQPKKMTDGDQPMNMTYGDQPKKMTDGNQPKKMTDGNQPMNMTDGDQPKKMTDGDQPMNMTDGDQPMNMTDGDQPKKMTDGDQPMNMSEGEEAGHGGSEGGLQITEEGSFDREITLKMAEWKYSQMNIEVKSGERIRFDIVNDGNIPHEFMFMTMPAMSAINYRATRADWSLLEHEALFEKSLILPGGSFSIVVEIEENGAWMFMCMLPYHMQMGMMGQMATAGMAMSM